MTVNNIFDNAKLLNTIDGLTTWQKIALIEILAEQVKKEVRK